MDNICLGKPIHINLVYAFFASSSRLSRLLFSLSLSRSLSLAHTGSDFLNLLKCYVTCHSTLILGLNLDIGGAIHDSSSHTLNNFFFFFLLLALSYVLDASMCAMCVYRVRMQCNSQIELRKIYVTSISLLPSQSSQSQSTSSSSSIV